MPRRRADGPALPKDAVLWRRSRRARQVSLRLDARAGAVVVTLPPRARRQAGLALLAAHAGWVRDSLAALPPALRPGLGMVLPLGDVPHRILRCSDATGAARLDDGAIRVPGPATDAPAQVLALLHIEAQRRIEALAARHAATLGVTIKAVRLKDLRTRWGSCAADGTLSLSWRLVMAPDWVLDYAVAHEVAHRLEMNHSDRFWAVVARLSPHRREAEAWLKAHGPRLLRIG